MLRRGGLNEGGVVGDGDREQLDRDLGDVVARGGALAQDGSEVAAGGGAAERDAGGVEAEFGGAGGDGPEEGFPAVVDCGGEGVFWGQSGDVLSCNSL